MAGRNCSLQRMIFYLHKTLISHANCINIYYTAASRRTLGLIPQGDETVALIPEAIEMYN